MCLDEHGVFKILLLMVHIMNRYDNYSPEIPINKKKEVPTTPYEAEAKTDVRPARRKRARDKKPVRNNKQRTSERNESIIDKCLEFFTSATTRLIVGLVLCAVGIYLGVSFISYFSQCVRDQASISNVAVGTATQIGNAGGEGGARLSEFLINETFGLGSFVIIFWLICIALKLLLGVPKYKTVNFTIKCIVALITVSLIIGLLTLGFNTSVNWGGYHGRYVNEFLIHFLGWTGAVILCLLSVSIFIVICLRDAVKWVIKKKKEFDEKRRLAAEAKAEKERIEKEIEEMKLREAEESGRLPEISDEDNDDEIVEDTVVKFEGAEEYILETEFENSEYNLHEYESDNIQSESHISGNDKSIEPISIASEKIENIVDESRQQSDEGTDNDEKMVVNVNKISQVKTNHSSMKHLYKFPPAELLRPGENKVSVDISEQELNKKRIKDTLLYHGIPITSIEATVGPTVTLYEIRPDQGVKIAKIKNLADDIALSLSAIGVRIIAPIPGKGTVGIEVANNDPQTVSMRTIIQSRKYVESRYKLPVALGSTIGNDVYIADLTKMPHLLVAGATGQGKSVGLNAIIASLLYKKRPDELKFVMIDPKEVEFSLYAKIEKHYLAKIPDAEEAIVTDMTKVVATLSSLCVEMDNRYKLLRAAQVRNIEEYNGKISENKLDPSEGHKFLPYIVVVVDEFADLIMTSGKEVETPIARLAQKARAVGMHVIIATQRPSTNVITGIIKANFPVRIAFKVTSGVDSKTILDTTGAQQLIGRGDMLISSNSQMVRVQCAFIDTPEVEEICNYISEQPFNTGAYILPEPTAGSDEDSGHGTSDSLGERDPLFEDAARYVVGSGTASTSALQRRYAIGYNRAGKIMDQMESCGFVGPSVGGKPRDVRIDMVGLEHALDNMR